MEHVKLHDHNDKLSFTSWNPKDTLRQINGHGQDIKKLGEVVNWLVDQIMAMKMPASTSVDAKTNQTKALNKVATTKED